MARLQAATKHRSQEGTSAICWNAARYPWHFCPIKDLERATSCYKPIQELEALPQDAMESALMTDIVKYKHHGMEVFAMQHLAGTHREHCLCFYGCTRFRPGENDNCKIAADTFANCEKHGLVTPVFECPEFVTTEQEHDANRQPILQRYRRGELETRQVLLSMGRCDSRGLPVYRGPCGWKEIA